LNRDKLVSILALIVGVTSLYVAVMIGFGALFVAFDTTLGVFLLVVTMSIFAAFLAAASWYRRSHRSGLFLLAAAIVCLAQTIFGNGMDGLVNA
jgi:hypothetical protein